MWNFVDEVSSKISWCFFIKTKHTPPNLVLFCDLYCYVVHVNLVSCDCLLYTKYCKSVKCMLESQLVRAWESLDGFMSIYVT